MLARYGKLEFCCNTLQQIVGPFISLHATSFRSIYHCICGYEQSSNSDIQTDARVPYLHIARLPSSPQEKSASQSTQTRLHIAAQCQLSYNYTVFNELEVDIVIRGRLRMRDRPIKTTVRQRYPGRRLMNLLSRHLTRINPMLSGVDFGSRF